MGFGAFYNAPWRVLWISIVCGMVGFPTRFLLMQGGMSQEIATLFSCLGIGIVAAVAVGRVRAPFSAISFAGAVPMMPGVFIYEAIAGSLRISAAGRAADPALVVATVALVLKAAFVVGAMTIGLLTGARLVDLATHNWFRRDRPVQRA